MKMTLLESAVVVERNDADNCTDDELGIETDAATAILERFIDQATAEIQRQFPKLVVKFHE